MFELKTKELGYDAAFTGPCLGAELLLEVSTTLIQTDTAVNMPDHWLTLMNND